MIRVLLAFTLAALPTLVSAQPAKIQAAPPETSATSASSEPKKLPATLPSPTPIPAEPAPDLPKRTPDQIVGAFFDALKADKVEAAYDTLDREFAMVDRGDQARAMREQTQKALDAYGPVLGSELVREEKVGTHLLRRTYVLIGEELPLRWKFYFYRPADRWKLIDLRIDDAIVEWFDGPKPTPKN